MNISHHKIYFSNKLYLIFLFSPHHIFNSLYYTVHCSGWRSSDFFGPNRKGAASTRDYTTIQVAHGEHRSCRVKKRFGWKGET